MSTDTHRTTLRPLPGYEPHAYRAGTDIEIPAQQRPSGQLSLPLHNEPHPAAPAPTFNHDKLAAVLRAVVEAYGGQRSLRQVRNTLHPDLYRRFAEPVRDPGSRYALRTVHARNTTADVIEACGLVHAGSRALAMCARFDRYEHGWLCTAFTVMEPRTSRTGGRR